MTARTWRRAHVGARSAAVTLGQELAAQLAARCAADAAFDHPSDGQRRPIGGEIARQGHDVLMSPVIEIYPTDRALPETANTYAALALTSANGAHALAAKAAASDGHKAWLDLPAFAVGPQTADALKAYGWPHIHEGAGDVDGLAALIIDRMPDTAKPVLHVAGRTRAGNLQAALAGENIACDLAMLYEAEPADACRLRPSPPCQDRQEPIDGRAGLFATQRKIIHCLKRVSGNGAKAGRLLSVPGHCRHYAERRFRHANSCQCR